MKRSTTLLSVLFLLWSFKISAQSSGISGNIIDEENEPVAFATVMLFNNADSAMVKAMASNENGVYSFSNVQSGNYYLQSTFIGFSKFSTAAFEHSGKKDLKLEPIKLQTQSEQLENVTIVAERPMVEVQPDKTVFNVAGSVNAKGNNALDLLRKSPGVVVDNNENLMLQGKSGVQVYVDGKRSPLSADDLAIFLKNLQSDQVDAIEVITNPSAKYDAEGNAGIINIRLVKDKNLGSNGSINTGFRYGWNPKYNGSINLNTRNKFMNVFGSYSYFDGENENNIRMIRELSGARYQQLNRMLFDGRNQGFRFGTDFFLSKKSTLGFLINGNNNDIDANTASDTKISNIAEGRIDSLLLASNNNMMTRNNTNFNINYEWRTNEGKSFSIDLDHGRYRNNGNSDQPNEYFLPDGVTSLNKIRFRNITPTDINIYTAKVDYETNLLEGKLGMGLKSTNITTDNTLDNADYNFESNEYEQNLDRSNNFVYKERVNAAYLSWQKQLNDKWNFMAGLRAEHTHSTGDLTSAKQVDDEYVERNYLNVFPSGGLTYKLDEKNSFRINYSRRIDRPNYQDLNPFEFKLDELSFMKGNPFLRPQYSNSYGLTHTHKHTLNTSLNYTVINDVSTRISKALDERTSTLTFVNLAKQTNLAMTISYPFSVKEWWNVYATVTGYRLHNEANLEGDIIDLTTHAFNFYGQNTFTLPKGFKVELSGWYNSPAIWAGNWTTDDQFDVSAGVSKELFQKRGNLKVSVSDIFFQNGWSGESNFGVLKMAGSGQWESRQVRVNFSYSFGNNQVKGARRRKTGMEDESKRVSSGQ
ncbi:MAG: TonB-dependent receptor [Cyclobacteriaceae bacterium]